MHIAINARSFINKNFTGIGRYSYNLVKFLSSIDSTNHYTLYSIPRGLFKTRSYIPDIVSPNFKVKIDWLKRGLKPYLKNVDVYHSPCPEVIPEIEAKIVVTIHDLVYRAFPQGHTEETIQRTDQQIKSFLPRASKIICCSTNTREDLHKYFDIARDKTCVVHQGVDARVFYPLEGERKKIAQKLIRVKGMTKPFILFIGTIEPRKNLKNLLSAFALLKKQRRFDGQCVVVGMKGWKMDAYEEQLKEMGLKEDVLNMGYVTNDDLRLLYNTAEVFVFPSFYEGFGFPILEAFSCGAAVVSSKTSSCQEVAGDAAALIDPSDPQEIAEGIGKFLEDKEYKASLIERGSRRAEEFSFEKTARETLNIYEEVHKGSLK